METMSRITSVIDEINMLKSVLSDDVLGLRVIDTAGALESGIAREGVPTEIIERNVQAKVEAMQTLDRTAAQLQQVGDLMAVWCSSVQDLRFGDEPGWMSISRRFEA
jgi:hypothetical protein